MASQGHSNGLRVREAIIEFFSKKQSGSFYEKYGLTEPEVPVYSELVKGNIQRLKFNVDTAGNISFNVSGVSIPLTDLPGYGEWGADFEYTPGFIAGLLGLESDASPIVVAREAQDKITYTDEVPTQQEEVVGGGAAFGPNLSSPVIKPDVTALSAESIDAALRNAVQMGQVPGYSFNEETDIESLDIGAMDEEAVIQFLIEVAPDIKFLGFQNRGYPLGYRERQVGSEEYGSFPVYLPDMSDSLYGGSGVPETYIGQLQDKLIRAGYLRSSFEPEVFDAATKIAVEEAMAQHNREGRVPPIPEVAGSLLDFLGYSDQMNLTKFAWDAERNREVADFLFAELDKDVATADERRFSDVLIEIPEFEDATAGYLMLNTLQQYFPAGSITLDNIKNATTLVNKVSADVAKDMSRLRKEAEMASIAAGSAAISASAEVRKLKERNPNLSDDELKLMYPDIFEQEAKVVGELAAFGAGSAERQSIMFQQRLGTAVQNLIQPELDFIDKQNSFDRATGQLLAANRGLNALQQGAPT